MNKKYAIITPTYIKHFKYIKNYLKSFDMYVEDKNNVIVYFIINKSEDIDFKNIVKEYKNKIEYKILYIEDLFIENNVSESPDEFLEKFGRYSFQTAKKFYSMLCVDADKFLVLDCESVWCKPTNMKSLFEEFFKNPYIITSDIEPKYRSNDFFNNMLNNISILLKAPAINQKWFIEHFMWFYDKNILLNLFSEHGNLYSMIQRLAEFNSNKEFEKDVETGIFEIVLYYAYLYLNKERYNYHHISLDDYLKSKIPSDIIEKYKLDFYKKKKVPAGLLERCLVLINDENYKYFADVFINLNFNIIRCDYTDLNNYTLQEKFLNMVSPNILAASSNHAFSCNNKFKAILFENDKNYKKIKKHIKYLQNSKNVIGCISELFSFFSYGLVFMLNFYKSYKKYQKIFKGRTNETK